MKAQDETDGAGATVRSTTRKPYEKPRLEVYGDLADVSKTVAGTKNNDGSTHPNKHFTV
jgi:hypothetical protein